MREKINNILKGIREVYKGTPLTPEQKKRAAICDECPLAKYNPSVAVFEGDEIKEVKGVVCSDCGCYLPAKIRVNNESCPQDKWGEIKEK
jgi:hypothetical protein